MKQSLMMTKKVLTKVRLINWYTFIDETIPFKGSTLISGENTQGKTTILDAIQMVLTADTHRFNQAANEKSNRSLIGYVRCKLGDDERSFSRTGVVISHVALEFYEEDKQKYFTIGVVLVSENSDSPVIPKWYRTECSLDLINFVEGGVPTLPRNLKQKGSPVLLLDRNAYKEQILIRFGRLENRFFDLIRNSIAFKPMKNVREFINNFLLPEKNVNVRNLRENIADVQEFEKLYDECQRQKDQLNYYIYIEERNYGALLKTLLMLVFPLIGMYCGAAVSMNGLWLGMGISFAAAFLLNWLLTKKWSRNRKGLLLMNETDYDRQLSYDINSTQEEVMALTQKVGNVLQASGENAKRRSLLVSLIEQLGLHAAERSGDTPFQLEYSILPGENASEPLRMILRDNAEPYDIIEKIKQGSCSQREALIDSLTAGLKNRQYSASGDENRMMLQL